MFPVYTLNLPARRLRLLASSHVSISRCIPQVFPQNPRIFPHLRPKLGRESRCNIVRIELYSPWRCGSPQLQPSLYPTQPKVLLMSFRSKSVGLFRSFADSLEKETVIPSAKAAVKTVYRKTVSSRIKNFNSPRITGDFLESHRQVTGS